MTCDICSKERFRLTSIGNLRFACSDCVPRETSGKGFLISKMVYFKDGEGRPIKISEGRLNMIKSRYRSPEDGNTVLMKDRFGRRTDRRAMNY